MGVDQVDCEYALDFVTAHHWLDYLMKELLAVVVDEDSMRFAEGWESIVVVNTEELESRQHAVSRGSVRCVSE